MVSITLLLVLLSIATVTDWRWRKIYNWNTYPGILIALAANALASWRGADLVSDARATWLGMVGIDESLIAFAICGGVMLVCYVFFSGGIGGGDIKLIAMIGAFLGTEQGIIAMLWTFVLGGCVALISLVWQVGPTALVARSARHVWFALRTGTRAGLSEAEREPLRTQLFLAPSAVLAVLIVRFELIPY